jgi:hypothetical protein
MDQKASRDEASRDLIVGMGRCKLPKNVCV